MKQIRRLLAHALALAVPLCMWGQTEIEPNNGSGQATALIYNTAMAGSIGACAPNDNSVDYFSFTPPSQGQLRVQSSMSNSGATDLEVTFQVRQSTTAIIGTFTLTAGANGVPVNDSFLFPCQGAGPYYISIENPSPLVCTNYSFTYDMVAPVFANDLEPNNSSGQATTVAPGVWHQGQIDFRHGDNDDYYRLDLPTHGVLTIEWEAEHVGPTSPAEATIFLRGTTTATIESWDVPVGANSVPASQSVSINCRSNSNFYYLSVETGICGTSYRFRYTVSPPLFANDAEPNNSSSQATTLAHSTPTEGQINFSTYVENSDYYRIDLPSNGVLNIQWEAEHAGTDETGVVTATLRTTSTSPVTTWDLPVGANSTASSQTVSIDCLSNTNFYYLSLESDICGVSYRFSYTVTPPIFNNDVEPNNSSSVASAIDHSTPVQGQINFSTYVENSDYYRLDLPTSGILNINWQGEQASSTPGTATLTLRQTSTAVLQSWVVPVGANSIPVSETVSIDCRGNQNFYYLEVNGVSCGISYQLGYTVTPPIYAFDPPTGISSSVATTIDLETATVEGQVGFYYGQSSAYYRIDHAGGPIVLDFLAEHAGDVAQNYVVRLRSSTTAQLAFVDLSAGGNSTPLAGQADFGTRAAGLYYIEVEDTPCGMSYAIQCNDDDGDGVCNANDLCPSTPDGEGVNSDGCACSQLTVDDSDPCTLDECTAGIVSNTFQDADNDGTCDFLDACPNDPNKIAPGECGCGVADTDSDNDGTANCNDLCPNDPNKIAPGDCGCGNLEPGTTCDDNDATTGNDVIQANCQCAGTPIDCNGDIGGTAFLDNCGDCVGGNTGEVACANDCAGVPGGTAFLDNCGECVGGTTGEEPCVADCNGDLGGTAFLDNCDDCVGGNTGEVACVADCNGDFGGTAFLDNCGDCVGGNTGEEACANDCAGVPGGTAFLDNCGECVGGTTGEEPCVADCNGDLGGTAVIDNCGECVGGNTGEVACVADCNGDFGGTAVLDNCGDCVGGNTGEVACAADCNGDFGGTALPGTPCNDGDDNTENDTWTADCQCAGTPIGGGCSLNELFLEFQTDGTSETTWEFVTTGTGVVVASGGSQYPGPGVVMEGVCLSDGCYNLRVFDDAGDGIADGGYILRNSAGDRIIDNRNNFTTGSLSAVGNGPSAFCLPIGSQNLMWLSRDKLDWRNGEYVVAEPDPAVSAVWIDGGANNVQSTTTGYQFWIFDPNGSFSYRRFRSHAFSDNFGPASATRACRMKVNYWLASNTVPENMLMNVRVRSRVEGVYGAWGPASRFKIDEVRAECPLTKLVDTPGDIFLSCEQTREFGAGNFVWARPVMGANRYQFRFRLEEEGFEYVVTRNTFVLQLNWNNPALEAGKTYDVDVRVSKDFGATWCTEGPLWGESCTISIVGENTLAGRTKELSTVATEFSLWPNPNNGDQLWLNIGDVEQGVELVAVEIMDLNGKRVADRMIPVSGANTTTLFELEGQLGAGVYIVRMVAGNSVHTERLVIAR